jgi:hypothetical protein
MIHRPILQISLDLPIIFTHVLSIPAITSAPVFPTLTQRKRRRRALERDITRAHNRLPQVLETVINVPRHLYLLRVRQFESVVRLEDGVETV